MRAYVGILPASPCRLRAAEFPNSHPRPVERRTGSNERLGRLLSEMSAEQLAAFHDSDGRAEAARFWAAPHGGLQ